jgi:SAM-dependent methyltransferase
MRVLDCSCGTGYGTFMLARNAKEVIGVDKNPEALAIAKGNWSRKNIRYLQLDVTNLNQISGAFDLIVSFETAEHVEDPRRFLRHAGECLHPHGTLIVSTPNKDVYRRTLEPNPFHIHEFTKQEFGRMLSETFNDVRWFGQLDPITAAPHGAEPKATLADRIARSPLGHSMYLWRMKRRFAVVEAGDPGRYVYMISVCRKQ